VWSWGSCVLRMEDQRWGSDGRSGPVRAPGPIDGIVGFSADEEAEDDARLKAEIQTACPELVDPSALSKPGADPAHFSPGLPGEGRGYPGSPEVSDCSGSCELPLGETGEGS